MILTVHKHQRCSAICALALPHWTTPVWFADIEWSLKLNAHMLNVSSRCAIEKGCINNSCSDGVRGTRQDQWSCQAVLSSVANLVINHLHMCTRFSANSAKVTHAHCFPWQISGALAHAVFRVPWVYAAIVDLLVRVLPAVCISVRRMGSENHGMKKVMTAWAFQLCRNPDKFAMPVMANCRSCLGLSFAWLKRSTDILIVTVPLCLCHIHRQVKIS